MLRAVLQRELTKTLRNFDVTVFGGAALTGHADKGFFITLILTGVDYQSTLPLIQKFLENSEWTP